MAGKPERLLAADLDGDGFADLVATLLDRPVLLLWSGTEDGLDRAAREVPVGGWPLGPLALPPGAFGAAPQRSLVALASRSERTLVLRDLTGDAAPREVWRGRTPRAMAVGDLGADGSLEIALATDGRELAIVRADGTRAIQRLAHDLPRCALVLASGAGVVVGYQGSRTLEVVAPGSAAPLAVLHLDGIPRDLVEVDLDSDGDLELLAVGGDGDAWAFGRGRSGGSRAWMDAEGAEPARWRLDPIPIDVEVLDLDGDGVPEIGVLARFGLSYELARGWDTGRPVRMAAGYAGQTPTSLAFGDFDGDGDIDLAVANRDARAVSIVRGDGRGGTVDVLQVPVGVAPSAVALADLMGDDALEIVALNSKSETLTIVDPLDLLAARAEHSTGPAPQALVVADLQGDERPEIAVLTGNTEGSRVELYGLVEGRVTALGTIAVGTRGVDLATADADGDGRVELWIAAPDAGQVIRLEGGRREAFPVPSSPVALCAIEFDGDAAPELAVALGAPGPRRGVAVLDLRVVGGALEVVEIGVVETIGWPLDVVACQLDGDGALDLAVLAEEQPGSVRAFVQPLYCELGRAYLPGRARSTGARPHHVTAADLDGDGLDDLLVAAQSGHALRVFLARPEAGALGLAPLDDVGAHLGCLDVAVGDLNGDGLPDLAVANGFSDDVSVVLGRPR